MGGKKESLSKSVDHTHLLETGTRLTIKKVYKCWKNEVWGQRETWGMGSPNPPYKFASKGHAEHLPLQLSPTRGLLIDDAFRRQQAVADDGPFP